MTRSCGASILATVRFCLLVALGRARGFDLEPCSSKSGAATACPASAAVACWSRSPKVSAWKCWSDASVPDWASNPILANAACQSMSDDLGEHSFAGACTFLPPSPGSSSPAPLRQPLTWAEGYRRAADTLQQMSLWEKQLLLQGIGWEQSTWSLKPGYYVGNTIGVARLGVPSLNMQDAADGFRLYWPDMQGTGTCWPSLLALGATFDEAAVQQFAMALGEEFSGKGANAILGPSVNVHRAARGGRNFEYISGEDPHLGAKLARAYIEGVQSKGVFAVAKHWAFNEQETNRNTASSDVDEKTAWNLYYPPFQAAVDAGVAAFMCSYNKVNGVHACSNEDLLNRDLKQRMGFQGFIQSDWWAAHEMSMPQGLDQEMPGTQGLFSLENLQEQDPKLVDDAVRRVLAVMHRFNLPHTTKCVPVAMDADGELSNENCSEDLRRNVTSLEHRSLARTLATESIVMLKNSEAVLPLSPTNVRSIAIVGSAATAEAYDPNGEGQGHGQWWRGDYYSGGGSGHVVASNLVTPLDGIRRRAEELGIKVLVPSEGSSGQPELAGRRAQVDPAAQWAGTNFTAAVQEADVTIVVAATTAQESIDRSTLSLDDDVDDLIATVAAMGKPTVVLAQTPGAVVMPWRDDVAAILVLFYGGSETGNAWASVLFGDHAPTGRLPVMMPESEADTILPSESLTVPYAEGLQTSYRNPRFKAAFPFGHGLTYTTFKHSAAEAAGEEGEAGEALQRLRLNVSNVGSRPGRTVVQAYVELPPEAGYVTPVLRSFKKTGIIMPGQAQEVVLSFSARDLSFYDTAIRGWQLPAVVTAHVGESSRDIRQKVLLKVPGGGIIPAARNVGSGYLIVLGVFLGIVALLVARFCVMQNGGGRGDALIRSDVADETELGRLKQGH